MEPYPAGGGINLGYEYFPLRQDFISFELRTKCHLYIYREENWEYKTNDFRYSLFSYDIGFVPKFYLKLSEKVNLLLENDFSYAYISGKTYYYTANYHKTNGFQFYYSISLGARIKKSPETLITVGYSTFNLDNVLLRNNPENNGSEFPSQKLEIVGTVAFIFPF